MKRKQTFREYLKNKLLFVKQNNWSIFGRLLCEWILDSWSRYEDVLIIDQVNYFWIFKSLRSMLLITLLLPSKQNKKVYCNLRFCFTNKTHTLLLEKYPSHDPMNDAMRCGLKWIFIKTLNKI
jgi:hypothetical protein